MRSRASRCTFLQPARCIDNAAPARDETDDGIGRRRLAALRRRGEEPVHAHDQHAAAVARRSPFCRQPVAALLRLDNGRPRIERGNRALQLAVADLAAPDLGEKITGLVEAEPGGELLETQCRSQSRHPESLQLLLDDRAALRDRRLEILAVEPLPHLGARAVARDVAQRRVQPVAARPALLRRQ